MNEGKGRGRDLERASESTFPVGAVTPWCLFRQMLFEKAIVAWRTCLMFLSHLLFVSSVPCARGDNPRTQLIRAWHSVRSCHFYCHGSSGLENLPILMWQVPDYRENEVGTGPSSKIRAGTGGGYEMRYLPCRQISQCTGILGTFIPSDFLLSSNFDGRRA